MSRRKSNQDQEDAAAPLGSDSSDFKPLLSPLLDDISAAGEVTSPRERVTIDIIKGLYDGRYQPGQRLVEGKLTEIYGVSRGPVREALYRLDQMGLIELHPQRGGQVRRLTIHDAIDILLIVQGLVQIAAGLAARNIDRPGYKEKLEAELAHLDTFDLASPAADYPIARDRFYSVITQLSGNMELQRIMPSVQIHLVRVQFRQITQPLDVRRHVGYRVIADAIFSGNPNKAENAVRRQFSRTIGFLEAMRDEGEAEAR